MRMGNSQAPPHGRAPAIAAAASTAPRPVARLEAAALQALIETLRAQGYTVIAPVEQEGVIALGPVEGAGALPSGLRDEQEPGRYRLHARGDGAFFAHTIGPQAWKRYLQPPLRRLWQARRSDGHFEIVPETEPPPRYAFVGVRPCDLRAIELLDRVYLGGPFAEGYYQSLRAGLLIVAVNCIEPGGTCFCASVGSGPRAQSGYDLALTEIVEAGDHFFLAEAGSPGGAALLDLLPQRPATAAEVARVDALLEAARGRMGRTLDVDGLPDLLLHNLDHPHWEEIAHRCLTCGNCTLVCPTCFCATVKDATTLEGDRAERWRRADSCFSIEFSHIYGGSIRQSPHARYRQWMVHKLATWVGQFGDLGCVGCGRCITWCPVGIDITAEAAAFRAAAKRRRARAAAPAAQEVN